MYVCACVCLIVDATLLFDACLHSHTYLPDGHRIISAANHLETLLAHPQTSHMHQQSGHGAHDNEKFSSRDDCAVGFAEEHVCVVFSGGSPPAQQQQEEMLSEAAIMARFFRILLDKDNARRWPGVCCSRGMC